MWRFVLLMLLVGAMAIAQESDRAYPSEGDGHGAVVGVTVACEVGPPTSSWVDPQTGSEPGTSMTVILNASDVGSGIDHVDVTVEECPESLSFVCQGEEDVGVVMTLFSGTTQSGVWHGTWTFPTCGEQADNRKYTIRSYPVDVCGNAAAVPAKVDDLVLDGRGC